MSQTMLDRARTSQAARRTAGAGAGESSPATGLFGERLQQIVVVDGGFPEAATTRAVSHPDADIARVGRRNHQPAIGVIANATAARFGAIASGSIDAASMAFLQGRGGLPPRTLRRVHEYIAAHLEENITIRVLARVAGLSMYHFARAFKQSEGVTPHRFLLQCRVRRAQELLVGTSLTLSEIAHAAGFSDQSHCARRFGELVGIPPSRYRRWMR